MQFIAVCSVTGMPPEMTSIASKLKEANYKTYVLYLLGSFLILSIVRILCFPPRYLIGKWDAGFAQTAQIPVNKGYDYFYGYLGKVISYFDATSLNGCPEVSPDPLTTLSDLLPTPMDVSMYNICALCEQIGDIDLWENGT